MTSQDDFEHEADQPLLAGDREQLDVEEYHQPNNWAVACLLLQHLSSTFNDGLYNFAAFLFLIEIFKDTLVPASLVGFFTTASSLLLSGYVGGLVDTHSRLAFVRHAIASQKLLTASNYALFLCLFGPLQHVASSAFHGHANLLNVIAVWGILILTITCSSGIGLSNTGLTVAVERDWVMSIAEGNAPMLTRLNTYMRRIDLLSKLGSPLFVSLLTATWGYRIAIGILLGMTVLSSVAELLWVKVVYDRFPQLALRRHEQPEEQTNTSWSTWFKHEKADWAEFIRLPIFGSSIAIASIYLTTLSYDGTFIAYVKAARGWDDSFIALMRGLCVLTGLLGTAVMPILERHIGLARAGAWSIWFEAACLAPTLVSFFYGNGAYGEHGPAWSSILLFGGIALSRIGLWSFDLCQLKLLQLALDDHPRRNRLTALQIALQNLFELAKYVVTLAAASPAQFKWTAVVSYAAVVAGGIAYAAYLRAVRGHLVHLDWFRQKVC